MNEINGLPAHVLIIHFVVFAVPLAGLLAVLSAVWPAARRKLGIVTPIVAALALISVPIATNAGEWLEKRVFSTDLVRAHTRLGDTLLWWVVGVFVVAVLAWGLPLLATRTGNTTLKAVWVRAVVGVLAVAFGVVSLVQVYRIGESGAKAAWNGNVCAAERVDNNCPNNQFLN